MMIIESRPLPESWGNPRYLALACEPQVEPFVVMLRDDGTLVVANLQDEGYDLLSTKVFDHNDHLAPLVRYSLSGIRVLGFEENAIPRPIIEVDFTVHLLHTSKPHHISRLFYGDSEMERAPRQRRFILPDNTMIDIMSPEMDGNVFKSRVLCNNAEIATLDKRPLVDMRVEQVVRLSDRLLMRMAQPEPQRRHALVAVARGGSMMMLPNDIVIDCLDLIATDKGLLIVTVERRGYETMIRYIELGKDAERLLEQGLWRGKSQELPMVGGFEYEGRLTLIRRNAEEAVAAVVRQFSTEQSSTDTKTAQKRCWMVVSADGNAVMSHCNPLYTLVSDLQFDADGRPFYYGLDAESRTLDTVRL